MVTKHHYNISKILLINNLLLKVTNKCDSKMQNHTPEKLKPTLHVIFHVPYHTDGNIRHKTAILRLNLFIVITN